MTNTYRALTQAGQAAFDTGVFERDFTPVEERDWLANGVLELVPRTYRVLSDNYELPKGETFEAALPIEVERAQIEGGHIERVDKPKAKRAKPKADTEPDKPEEAVADEPTMEQE